MANLVSFQADLRSLFAERDIQALSKAFNLASYDDVKAHAAVSNNLPDFQCCWKVRKKLDNTFSCCSP
jgi:hypothetical protein